MLLNEQWVTGKTKVMEKNPGSKEKGQYNLSKLMELGKLMREFHSNYYLHQQIKKAWNKWSISATEGPIERANWIQNL